jgi:HEAT repeat protein
VACEPLARALVNDKDANVRTAAITAMTIVRPPCPQALAALTGILGQRQFWVPDALARLGKPAVPALAAALRSPDLYVREQAVAALAQMKPLTPQSVQALMIALKDKNLDVRSAAAVALQNAGGEAERAALAEQAREQQPDIRRYTRQQIIAAIPADADHKYPLTLAYLFPIYPNGYSAREAEFLITLHTGKGRPERLVFWKKTGDDQYTRMKVIESDDPDFAEQHFETPITFIAKVREDGSRFGETQLFVDVPVDGWRSHIDQVFALDYGVEGDEQPVEIESPEKSYKDKLGPREAVRHPGRNSFSNGALEFAFSIWNANDPECCPTGGQVVGTYKIIKQTGASSGWGMLEPESGAIIRSKPPTRAPTTTLKMVVDTAVREPMPRPVKRTQ